MLLLLWGVVFGLLFTEIDKPFNPALNNVSATGRMDTRKEACVLQMDKNWYTNESVWSLSFF